MRLFIQFRPLNQARQGLLYFRALGLKDRFTGQQNNVVSGLYHVQQRVYSRPQQALGPIAVNCVAHSFASADPYADHILVVGEADKHNERVGV